MIYFKSNKGAVSMVEVVVTSVIFIAAAIGVIATTSSFRPAAVDASSELQALYQAKQFLEELRSSVDASTFDNCPAAGEAFDNTLHNPLCPTLGPPDDVRTQTFGPYTINYSVEDIAGSRQVDLNIIWN